LRIIDAFPARRSTGTAAPRHPERSEGSQNTRPCPILRPFVVYATQGDGGKSVDDP
jgi:hypothetical protein